VRAGESFLFVFVDSLRFQRSTRLRAGFVRGKSSKRRASFTESGQITDAEAQSVAEEKKGDCQKNTDAIKEKEESEGVAESLAKKENESVSHSVTEKIAVADPGTARGGGSRSAPNANTFPHAGGYRSANDCERHHSTGRC